MQTTDVIHVRIDPTDPWVQRTFLAKLPNGFLCMAGGSEPYPQVWTYGAELDESANNDGPSESNKSDTMSMDRSDYSPFTNDTFPRAHTLIRSLKLHTSSFDVVTGVRSDGVSHGKSDERIPFHKLLDRWDISIDAGETWHPAGQL